MINLIACISKDYGLGINGNLIYHIPEDLKRFKELTLDKTVVMGRKTFDSLPNGALEGRRNIVLTRDTVWSADGGNVVHSIHDILKIAMSEDIFVIGGGEIYNQMLPYADLIYLTVVQEKSPKGTDVWFPKLQEQWIISEKSDIIQDTKTGYKYIYLIYERNKCSEIM